MSTEPDEPVRILIVDDNLANLVALEAVLESLGQTLVLARSGKEALQQLEQDGIALVLMDVHMPVMDGFETVEIIRRREDLRHVPVMFLTAMYKDQESAARGYALGAVDFILKPFEPGVIRAKVNAFVALYQYNKRQQRQRADEAVALRTTEDMDRMKREFISVLGHDLRTPVNAILQAAQTHERTPDVLEPYRDANRRITSIANRMGRVLDEVVDFTRTRLGSGIPIDREAADMAELCRAPLDEIQAINPDSKVSVHVEGDVKGEWDPDRVLQVVANLVCNAVRHGDGTAMVTIRGAGEWVFLDVHNGGDPIPAHKLAHLFEPFTPSGGRREGLGLGLYIVEQIVRAHGGIIRAESTEMRGTTIHVRWPRHEPAR